MSWHLFWRIIIDGKVYLSEGSIDNALFSEQEDNDSEKVEKPKGMSKAAFKRSIEQ